MSTNPQDSLWGRIKDARRIVVKAGTSVLLDGPASLVTGLAALKKEGREIIFVTSGAIGTGMQMLGMKRRPKHLPELQMAAAVGQSRLMAHYDRLFAEHGCMVGQVLLTHDDLKNRKRHLNARQTMVHLLRHGVIPIINENDVIAVDEIKVGDNDILASLVAVLISADLLILLSTTDGLHQIQKNGQSERIDYVPEIDNKILSLAKGKGSELSTGGMATKLQAAKNILSAGGLAVIADGRKPNALADIFSGHPTGTLFGLPEAPDAISKRKQWIAFFNRDEGTLIVDAGAQEAVLNKGKSLLPVGIKDVHGDFEAGALVRIESEHRQLLARGLVDFSSQEISQIKGHTSADIATILGYREFDEVIHRDNLVLENH